MVMTSDSIIITSVYVIVIGSMTGEQCRTDQPARKFCNDSLIIG